MSDAQKHPLLESTSSGEVWFGFANDRDDDDDEKDAEKPTAAAIATASLSTASLDASSVFLNKARKRDI